MKATATITPMPHAEGAKFLRNKPAITRAIFDTLPNELRARALVITGIEALDVVARIRDRIAELPLGADYEDIKADILAEMSPFLITSTDPDERAKQTSAARRRAEMLLRMHGWQTYARTQHALMEAHADAFPYRQYLSSEDGRVRPTHEALNRKILPANHPFWENHTPPWEFGCRCDCVPLTQDEVDEIRAAESSKPPEDKEVLPDAQLREIELNQRIVKPGGQGFLDLRTPRERDGEGYEWRPGDDVLPIDQILSRFGPAERATWEDYAARQRLDDGRTLLDWLLAGRAPTPANVPAAPAPQAPTPAAAPAPAPAPRVPAPAPPSAAAPAQPANRKAPVSDALKLKIRDKSQVKIALDAIDSVHDDGVLPEIPLDGQPGSDPGTLGAYTRQGPAAVKISVRSKGMRAALTTVHEVGHFLDHQAFGNVGLMSSEIRGTDIWDIVEIAIGTPTVQEIPNYYGPRSDYTSYLLRRREIWARAYAQYIAEESGDATLLSQLNATLLGAHNLTQWPAQEFAPIRQAITDHFKKLNWK